MAIRERAQGMLEAFNSLGYGAVLVDLQGCVLATNPQFNTHLGSVFQLVDGYLSLGDRRKSIELERLLRAKGHPARSRYHDAILVPRDGVAPLVIYKIPLSRRTSDGVSGISSLMLVVDPSRMTHPSAALLKRAFGLTTTEVHVAQLLAEGHDLAEVAKRRDVTIGTLRVQLKAIFAKTGTNRQAQLVVLLARLALD